VFFGSFPLRERVGRTLIGSANQPTCFTSAK
jgi:hypothetical protein